MRAERVERFKLMELSTYTVLWPQDEFPIRMAIYTIDSIQRCFVSCQIRQSRQAQSTPFYDHDFGYDTELRGTKLDNMVRFMPFKEGHDAAGIVEERESVQLSMDQCQ